MPTFLDLAHLETRGKQLRPKSSPRQLKQRHNLRQLRQPHPLNHQMSGAPLNTPSLAHLAVIVMAWALQQVAPMRLVDLPSKDSSVMGLQQVGRR